jgi:hypothetical protein
VAPRQGGAQRFVARDPDRAAPSTESASPNRCRISAGSRTLMRAAANSSANGIPSSRRHRSITACALPASSSKPGRTWAARSTKSRTLAVSGRAQRGSQHRSASATAEPTTAPGTCTRPGVWSGSRLVASTSTPGHPARTAVTRWAQAASRCSQLSSTISSLDDGAGPRARGRGSGGAPDCNPSASATASATSTDSPTAARSTNHTPSA